MAVMTSGEGCPNNPETGTERSISKTSNERSKLGSKNNGYQADFKLILNENRATQQGCHQGSQVG